jgi:hypothetical protein
MSWTTTIARLRERYEWDPNILAIARGIKFRKGSATAEDAVVFFVAKKRRQPAQPVPRHVFDVRRDGSLDRSRRHATDVRELSQASARSSGRRSERVLAIGAGPIERGTITLAFDSRVLPGPARRMLLSCSHVLADIWGRRDLDEYRVRGIGDGGRRYRGQPVVRTKARRVKGEVRLTYDAALARIGTNASAVPRWSIPRLHRQLTGLYTRPLQLRQRLSFLGAATGQVLPGIVATLAFPAPLDYRMGGQVRRVKVGNLYELAGAAPADGDSGGIVFVRDQALGLVVGGFFDAQIQQWTAVFHRISSVVSHLQGLQDGADAAAILAGPPGRSTETRRRKR